MDLIVGLPRTRRQHDSIWVIVDRMTKSAHFLPVKVSYSSEDSAKLYLREMVRLHGVPLSIISEHCTQFTSQFWKSFQKGLGTRVKLSMAFHPQTNGQAENDIQTLEDMLRACVIDFKGNWDDHLPLIEFAYNNIYHLSIYMAPFEALYGRRCRSPIGWFEVGEVALIDLPNKLASVHLVFHVSMFKKCVGEPTSIVSLEGLGIDENLSYEEVPVEILDRQVKKLRNKEVAYVKVLWRNHFVEGATWEAEADMMSRWERSRGKDTSLPTCDSFTEAFIDHSLPREIRDSRVDQFLNLRQGGMSVREYGLRFDSLARYAPTFVDTMHDRVCRFMGGLDSDYIEVCSTAALNDNMDISRIQAFA
ncbi:hypothetical protein KY290_038105 [Solanum tuberosum]|uniref:Integrase catalytic domain-containing protein n=1 Tax=Solanum tuberosum TaxID=4113 RepID=A0ABQ7U170_SOLTU|nr:hypothetical protein KY290_038105 [Solanum tuberosum]